MAELKLGGRLGGVALVDDADYPLVATGRWCGQRRVNGIYVVGTLRRGGEVVALHRFLMQPEPGQVVDHINRDPLDNRRENLRLCAQSDNAKNRGKAKPKSSRFKGVCLRKRNGRWRAMIDVNGVRLNLGDFDNEEHAARAYDRAALEFHGSFAMTNEALGFYSKIAA